MKGHTAVRLSGFVVLSFAAMLFVSNPAAAQGPAGAGAAEAAAASSGSHSYNPTKWFGKKDSKSGAAGAVPVEQLDARLEPRLREARVLAVSSSLKDACRNFIERVDCVAALRASHSLGLNLECVRAAMTGVRTEVDASSCRMPPDDKPLSLMKTIRLLKSDADAKKAAKEAETSAREDLKEAESQISASQKQ
jgi:hypothetical protein